VPAEHWSSQFAIRARRACFPSLGCRGATSLLLKYWSAGALHRTNARREVLDLIACLVLHVGHWTCCSERLSPEEIYHVQFLLSCYARGMRRALQIGLEIEMRQD
jgi:hypothetical protein